MIFMYDRPFAWSMQLRQLNVVTFGFSPATDGFIFVRHVLQRGPMNQNPQVRINVMRPVTVFRTVLRNFLVSHLLPIFCGKSCCLVNK